MGFLPKKILNALWGVREPKQRLAPPLDCDACAEARAAGRDACDQHHVHHPRPHTYTIGHELGYGSGLDGRPSAASHH